MAKKKLTLDPQSGKLSRLNEQDLPLIAIDGLHDGDPVVPFGTSPNDIIQYCVYDMEDNYLASGELEFPLPTSLDVGAHVRNLGFERGNYQLKYNFLRRIGGSDNVVLTKKSDKSLFNGQYVIEPDGRIFASHSPTPDSNIPIIDENGELIELLVQEDKYWLQEISPSRTEIRIRPNPAIVDLDWFEKFRLLGFTCLSFSDVNGESHITFSDDGKVATINNSNLQLDQSMVGGTLKIREAFVIDYEETKQEITNYTPVVDLVTLPITPNLVTNGDFSNGDGIKEVGQTSGNHDFPNNVENPGNSKYILQTESDGSRNNYTLLLDGIPGENYIISCWAYWTDDWPDSQKQLLTGGIENNNTFTNFNDTDRQISSVKIIDDKQWNQYYKVITIPENSNGTIKLNLGMTNSSTDTGTRWITNVQVEAGSLNGAPTPFIVDERAEETDSPTSGLVTFISDNRVQATLTSEDEGFVPTMAGEVVDGVMVRNRGILTIRDAYVVDETFSQNEDLIVVDEIPLKNPDGSDISKAEREFRVSPYHGMGDENFITLQVDNQFDLFATTDDGNETFIGSGDDWRVAQTFDLPNQLASLRIVTTNDGGPAAFIAKIIYSGTEIKTGDASLDYEGVLKDWQRRTLSGEVDLPPAIERVGPWSIISNSDSDSTIGNAWKTLARAGKGPWGDNVDDDLRDCKWIWSSNLGANQELQWEWNAGDSVTEKIWQFPDPDIWSDAVKPEGWSDGFNSFNWGGNDDRRFDRSRWHSGWLGYHAKWVDGEGEFGGTAIKMIDKNSQFGAPNHDEYEGIHKTGFNTDLNQPTTLVHRWMGISQTLPHKMVAQGVEVGDQITVTWTQKSDTPNKGAMVGLYHYRKSNGQSTWGSNLENHPATIGDDENGIPMNAAFEREFLRYIPISKVGEWEQVSWTGTVEADWDLTKPTVIYIYGHYGPEGITWVENVSVAKTEVDSSIHINPTTAPLVAQITEVNGDILTLNGTYEGLAPDGAVLDNDANIRSFQDFTDFSIMYTSSLAEKSPVYGSLRGDIQQIVGNNIFLTDSYELLGQESDHDFSNDLDITVGSHFPKWFIQYPNDSSQDLSKLVKTGPDDYHLISNFKIDTQTYEDYPHAVAYKLYEPLPNEVKEKDFVTIVREMIPPIEENIELFPFVEESISDIVLRTPEFQNLNSPIGAGITEFQSYNNLVSNDPGIKEEIENELISGSFTADINVDYGRFENFIHFSSAEQRLKNFKYKLDLIESYTDRSASLAGAGSGSTGRYKVKADPGNGAYLIVSESGAANPSFVPVSGSVSQIQHWENKRREVITNFDNFEKYMFNQTSSFTTSSIGLVHENAWPKESGAGTYSSPYVLYRTSQSLADTWYSNQLVSASNYDKSNKHRLQGHLPMFIQDDESNNVMLKFIDMMGHHFDDIWTFVKAMTDVHDKRDKLTEGIAKNLLHPVAQSLGWEVFDGKDLISLPQYMFGMSVSGSETPHEYSVTPDRDISREIWSRIVSNIPYFLKTKGTSRAIKGLISCYGIPSTILRVMEYGGPKLPDQPSDYQITRKFTKALNFFGAPHNTYVEYDAWTPSTQGEAPTDRHPDTIEFRFRAASGSNQVLVRRGTDWAIRLKDNGSSDRYGHVSFMLSGSNGYSEVSSSELPVYDGDYWSVMLTRTLKTGGYLESNFSGSDVNYNLYTKQYDSGRSKIVYESEQTMLISGSMSVASASYNLSYSGSGTTVTIGGPEENTFFGESFSGSMMEYRNWTTPLFESAFDNHVAAPISFDGNSISASYVDLVTRYSFDDDKDLSDSSNQWFQDSSADQTYTSSAAPYNYTSLLSPHFVSVVDENKFKVPNLGPSSKSAKKLRIETDERIDKVGNPVLKFGESITIPAYDNAPIDSNKLGIFFSPSAAIDEDIISSFPNIDFDQYIGDPRDQYKEQYTGLQTARNLYWKKYAGPNNFWDYLRLLKYYDSSLYKQVKSLIPARANATVGILIEPTIFERDKVIIGKVPTLEPSHHVTRIDVSNEYSESADFKMFEDKMNWSNPFGINKEKMVTGSYLSSSAAYETFETNLTYVDPFRVNYYTQQSGSEPRGFISASAEDITPWGLNTAPLNFRDPFRRNQQTQETGSGIVLTADFVSFSAPSDTLSEQAAGTGSFVLKHILERPALYGIGDRDTSGYYGSDYFGSTIQKGSVKTIFEEVLMPRVEDNVLSKNNMEVMYFYTSSVDAARHMPNSSSFILSDLDNKWDEAIGTNRLFYEGCVLTEDDTIQDSNNDYAENSPAFETFLVSPTKLVTGDKTTTKLEVKNK